MNYRVIITPAAQRQIEKLPRPTQRRILLKLTNLAENPFGRESAKLAGQDDLYRIRTGDFRIIYQILKAELTVAVVKVAHRKDVYR